MGILLALGTYLGSGPGGDGGRGVEDFGLGGKMIKHPGLSKTLLVLALEILMFQANPQTRANSSCLPYLLTREQHSSGVTAGPPLLCDLNCDLNTASVLTALGFSFLTCQLENNIASFIGGEF